MVSGLDSLANGPARARSLGRVPPVRAGGAAFRGFWLVVATLCSSAAVWAQEVTPRTQASLQVRGSARCGSVSELSERVASRSDRIAFIPNAQRKVDVEIVQGPAAWSAVLVFAGPARAPMQRNLQARSCEALLDAVAFVVTITLDPPSAGEPPTDGAVPSGSAPVDPDTPSTDVAPNSGSAPSPGRVDSRPSDVGHPPARQPSYVDIQPLKPPEAIVVAADGGPYADLLGHDAPGTPMRFGFSLLGRWAHAAAPSELFGVGLAADLQLEHATWASGVKLGLGYFPARQWQTESGVASFELAELNLELCPLLLRLRSVRVGPCAALVAGRLSARGIVAERSEQHTRPWGFWGGGLHASLDVLPVQVALGLRAGPTWVRDAFQFAPHVFYRVPDWGAQADLGLGLVLP